MVVFFFFCEEYSFGLFFRGVKIIGRSNPSSSRASSSSSSRQSRRCASSSFDPTPFFIRGASASAQTSSSSSPLRWSFFSLDSKSGDDFGDGVSPMSIQKSPHRVLSVVLCSSVGSSSSSSSCLQRRSLSVCVYVLSLSRSLSIVYIMPRNELEKIHSKFERKTRFF